jgi:hypothetical protein
MWQSIIDWFESSQGSCVYVRYLGVECPGCGIQRAFVLLLKGQLWDSIVMYPALIPLIALLFYLISHLIFKFNKGATVLKWGFIAVTVLIVGTFIARQLM